jgi:hypothetical protein
MPTYMEIPKAGGASPENMGKAPRLHDAGQATPRACVIVRIHRIASGPDAR